MSSYRVPQDVEADDKLLGPFSFRQFVYILIATAGVGVAYVLFQILPPLVVIPVPVIAFFLILALPLRKDQPMEIYLAAILSFYLKPRKRMWDPDGVESLVQIAAPRTQEPQRVKNVSMSEAEQRLRYLSDLSDTRGWSVRGVNAPQGSSMNPDIFNEAQQLPDTLDANATIAQNLDHMLSQSDQRRHTEMMSRFQQSAAAPQPAAPAPQPAAPAPQPTEATPNPFTDTTAPPSTPIPDPYAVLSSTPQPTPAPQQPVAPAPAPEPAQPAGDPESLPSLEYNPYPTSMNQSMLHPLSEQPAPQPAAPTPVPEPAPAEPAPSTSAKQVSPDILKLANNADLSIETIAREANRINEKEDEQEVVISLR